MKWSLSKQVLYCLNKVLPKVKIVKPPLDNILRIHLQKTFTITNFYSIYSCMNYRIRNAVHYNSTKNHAGLCIVSTRLANFISAWITQESISCFFFFNKHTKDTSIFNNCREASDGPMYPNYRHIAACLLVLVHLINYSSFSNIYLFTKRISSIVVPSYCFAHVWRILIKILWKSTVEID